MLVYQKFGRSRLIRIIVIIIGSGISLAHAGEEAKNPRKEPVTPPATAEARMNSIEGRLSRLEESLAQLIVKLSADDAEVAAESAEIVDALAAEAGEISDEISGPSQPVAAQSTQTAQTTQTDQPQLRTQRGAMSDVRENTFGGYMEVHVNHDNVNPTVLDFHRFVLLYGHQFNDRINFVGEVEIEHALVEGGEPSGELEIEQAFLDFLLFPNLSFRAGMMLVPMGIVNERHEPASFNGVERPFVDTVIIPTTWFSNGAGLVGDLGKGFTFRAFTMSTLNAALFSAEEGFRDGRQKGFFDNASNMAFAGRLEWAGIQELNLGTSFWIGNTGFEFPDISARTYIYEFDGDYHWKRLQARGQFAYTNLEDAGRINRAIQFQTGVNPNIAEAMRGFYLEGGFHVLPSSFPHDMVGFYRYENFDTQFTMPEGFLPIKQFDRSAHILGVTYFPHPDIAFKFDYNFMQNESRVIKAPNRWNFGIGWWF